MNTANAPMPAFVERRRSSSGVLSVLVPAIVYVVARPVARHLPRFGHLHRAVHGLAPGQVLVRQERRRRARGATLPSSCMFEVWFKVPLFKGQLDPLRIPRLLTPPHGTAHTDNRTKSAPS